MMIRVIQFRTTFRAGKEPFDEVLIAPAGAEFERTQTWHRVNSMRPPETDDPTVIASLYYKDLAAKWSVVGPAYEAWKNGQEIPEDGTPLAAWSGVTAEQADWLRKMGIRTVEDVRDMGDATAEKLQIPNARKLPALAKKFLEGEVLTQKDAKIAEMEERIAAMTEMLEEQMKAQADDKPRRGRPPKAKAEADAA